MIFLNLKEALFDEFIFFPASLLLVLLLQEYIKAVINIKYTILFISHSPFIRRAIHQFPIKIRNIYFSINVITKANTA